MGSRILVLLSVSFAIGLAGCGSDASPAPSGSEPTTGISYNYVSVAGPAELERESTVVVRGTTGVAQEGRIWGASAKDPGAQFTLVFPIDISEVEAGHLDRQVGDTAYLEMFVGGSPARERLATGLSRREGLFYLYRMPDRVEPPTEMVDAGAGRPAGQPIYQPASPEGTFIEATDGSGVWSVGTGTKYFGSSLDDFLPDRQTFPTSSEQE